MKGIFRGAHLFVSIDILQVVINAAGHDHELRAEYQVIYDASFKVVAANLIESSVGASTFESVIIQQFSEFRKTSPVGASKFDPFVAHFGDCFQCTREILLRRSADGIEL